MGPRPYPQRAKAQVNNMKESHCTFLSWEPAVNMDSTKEKRKTLKPELAVRCSVQNPKSIVQRLPNMLQEPVINYLPGSFVQSFCLQDYFATRNGRFLSCGCWLGAWLFYKMSQKEWGLCVCPTSLTSDCRYESASLCSTSFHWCSEFPQIGITDSRLTSPWRKRKHFQYLPKDSESQGEAMPLEMFAEFVVAQLSQEI